MLVMIGGGIWVVTGIGEGAGLITIGSGEDGSDSGSSGRRVVVTSVGEALELVGLDILWTRDGTREGGATRGVRAGTWLDLIVTKCPLSEGYSGMMQGLL